MITLQKKLLLLRQSNWTVEKEQPNCSEPLDPQGWTGPLCQIWAGGGLPAFDLVNKNLNNKNKNNGGQPVNRMFTSKEITI